MPPASATHADPLPFTCREALTHNLLRYDRALDSYGAQTGLYEKLDTSAVNAALKKYLNPEQLVEVMAGSFE